MRILIVLCLLAPFGFLVPGLANVIWAADLLCLLALCVDAIRVPDPRRLDVRRSLPDRIGLSQPLLRVVRIDLGQAKSAAGLEVELFEEFSPVFEVRERTIARTDKLGVRRAKPALDDPTGGADSCILDPNKPVRLERVYSCAVRGVRSVGDMRIRITGPLGLMQRQRRLFGSQSVQVEPALLGLKNTLKLAASDRWFDLGVRLLRRRGGVTEFESMREYVKGDDQRTLDWKAYAKRGRPMVRQYQEERGQELILLIDRGRRMATTTAMGENRGWTKLDYAIDSALQLAAVALDRGDRVGIATFDVRMDVWVPPARGRSQFGRLRGAVFDSLPCSSETSLGRALQELSTLHRRRATVLIVSDVADVLSAKAQREALSMASSRHRVIFAGLDDPAVRAVALGEIEAGAAERAAAQFQIFERERGLAELARSGARVLGALPAESAAPMLAAWLEARRAG